MDEIDALQSVLDKDGTLIAGVQYGQWHAPTPCPEFDVRALVNHVVGWLQNFEAAANGRQFNGDPTAYQSDDPLPDFLNAAAGVVNGWREGGVDRKVSLMGPELPAKAVLDMTLMEYVTHGCDLAKATEQPIPFTDEELELTLERARETLPAEYRGPGKPFGDIVSVPDDAPLADQLLGFMGRQP